MGIVTDDCINFIFVNVTNLIHSLASSLKWLDRPLGKKSEVRGHGNVVRLLVGSMMAERTFNARRPSYLRTRARGCPPGFDPLCLCPCVGLPGGPNTSLLSFTRFCFHHHRPLLSGPQALVRPQEKKLARCCRFESHNDSEFIARKLRLL